MPDIKKYEPLWNSWYIESLIGEGPLGKVYKACQKELDPTSYSAVKIISLSQNQSERKLPEFKALLADITSEIDQMMRFCGEDHIINFEDYKIIEARQTEWDFLIRMELLQPLSCHIKEKPLPQAEVLKLGIHICRALERFHLENITHRSIKPENIFVTCSGEYKLGDFGIGRRIEPAVSDQSKIGTYSTMAPEVFKSKNDDIQKIDIYALGIMLFSLLNQNRGPFLPDSSQATLDDHKKAFIRRINGEPLPELRGINSKLNGIVLRACAYNPGSRFASPSEMLLALEEYVSETPIAAAECLGPVEYTETTGQDKAIKHTGPTINRRPYDSESFVSQTTQVETQIQNKIPSIPYKPRRIASLQAHDLSQKEADKNDPVPALTGPPPKQAKIVKRNPFIKIKDVFARNKRRSLLMGLTSGVGIVVVAALALFITTLNDRYGISINGQTSMILANEEEAQAVLNELTSHYISLTRDTEIGIVSVTYEEDIKVVKINARASEVMNKDQVLQDLIDGQIQTLEYTAAEGETIQEIAQKYSITEESILIQNEGLTSPLTEGTPIKLVVPQPYLHMIIEGFSGSSEDIGFTTETKEDATLALNTTKVQQEGESGSKDITYTVVFKNGVLVEKTVLEEAVTKEPVPEIVLKGTKQPPRLAVASSSEKSSGNLNEDQMLQYIINRESGGNIYATNGKYKGIGQLQEQHYQNYVNMSYAETLKQPDPYAVQLEALLGYINGRYGSIERAYNHWLQKGWY